MAFGDDLSRDAAWLRRLAGALVRDDAAAEDLVQETWLVALAHPGAAERPWLRRVLVNLARMRGRSDTRRGRRETWAAGPAEGGPGPDELAEQRRLLALVGELPEAYRSVVLLRYLEGRSAAEIARDLGLPEGTVRWRLKEALDRLRARLRARRSRGLLAGVVLMKKAIAAAVLVVGALLLLLLLPSSQPSGPPAVVAAARPRIAVAPAPVSRVPPSSPPAPPAPSGCPAELHGTVVDAAGGVVAGAQIDARPTGSTTTDLEGHYRLCVRIGELRVTVWAEGYGALATRRSARGRTQIDFALAPEAVVVGRVVLGDSVTPVPGAVVFLYPELRERAFAPAARSTTSDLDGRFRIEGVAAGAHRVGAMAGDLVTDEQQRVALAPGQTSAAVLLRVSAAPRLEGTVLENGRPLAGAHVVALGGGSPSRDAVSGPDGRFVLRLVPIGAIRFDVDGYAVDAPESLSVDSLLVTDVRVEVHASADGPPADQSIVAGDLHIAGTVVDSSGRGQPLVRVDATGPTRVAGATTDMTGRFVVAGLVPGRYALVADSHGRAVAEAGDTDVTLELLSPGALVGSLDRFSARVAVFAFAEGTEGKDLRVARQAGGAFRIDDLPPGRYLVVAQGEDEGAVTRAEVASGETRDVVLASAGSAGLHGRLLSEDGSPLAGWACVALSTLPDVAGVPGMVDWVVPAMTRLDGTFTISRAPAGDVDVSCQGRARPYPTRTTRLRVDPGATAEVVLSGTR